MPIIPSFAESHLRAICEIIGDTDIGLTGTEIGALLAECGITDLGLSTTKRHRLFDALRERQRHDKCANQIIAFIQASMNPVSYVRTYDLFQQRRADLNGVLAFVGLSLGDDGKITSVQTTRTLTEAQERAGRLRRILIERHVHSDVLRFCRAELLQDNYFHTVFEAAKSVADKIRDKSGLISDGSLLVDESLGKGSTGIPLLAFNSLQTDTELSEHRGLMNLLKGFFGTFRNTTAHAPKIKWVVTEEDALDMLALASLLHRRLDKAVRTR